MKLPNPCEQVCIATQPDAARLRVVIVTLKDRFTSAAWLLPYRMEEARQRYSSRRQLLRQAGACLLLALLRLAGVIRA